MARPVATALVAVSADAGGLRDDTGVWATDLSADRSPRSHDRRGTRDDNRGMDTAGGHYRRHSSGGYRRLAGLPAATTADTRGGGNDSGGRRGRRRSHR